MTSNFTFLLHIVRRELRARIAAGETTGVAIAKRVGLQQAHISNFMTGRRGLSFEAADRLLQALDISLVDLLPQPSTVSVDLPLLRIEEINSGAVAAERRLTVSKCLIDRIRPRVTAQTIPNLLAVELGRADANGMYPILRPNATVILDRRAHDYSRSNRRDSQMFCIARIDGTNVIRLIEEVHGTVILRGLEPHIEPRFLRDSTRILGIVKYILQDLYSPHR